MSFDGLMRLAARDGRTSPPLSYEIVSPATRRPVPRGTLHVAQPSSQDVRAARFRSQYGAQALAAAARAGREVLDIDPLYVQHLKTPTYIDPMTGRALGGAELLERMPETDFAPEHILAP